MHSNNEIYEEYLMRGLRNKLTLHLMDIIKFNVKLEYHGSKNYGGFHFHMNRIIETVEDKPFNIELHFNILYEDKLDILYRYNKMHNIDNMSDKELEDKLNQLKSLRYAVIDWISVNPQNTGIGTKIVDTLIKDISNIDTIKSIHLNPKNDKARDFWIKKGFAEVEYLKVHKNLPHYNMVLNLKN